MSSPHDPSRSADADHPSPDAHDANPETLEDWETLRVQLQETEAALTGLRLRFEQVQEDQQRRDYLQQQQQRSRQDLKQADQRDRAALKQELRRVQHQLDEVELALESRLFTWSSFKEPFWLAVRFGGLGVVLGWILRSLSS